MATRREKIFKRLASAGVRHINANIDEMSDDELEELAKWVEERKEKLLDKHNGDS